VKSIDVAGIGIAGISAMVAVAVYGQADTTTASNGPKAEAVADAAGNLHVPDAYRISYQSLGTWTVAADQGQGAKELHVVYASPGTITAYRKGGRFPDGAVLVKEVFEAATGPMTTGTVSHAQALKGWFVMVKDSQGRHPGNKLWGGRLGLVVVRRRQPVKDNVDRSQNELSALPCAGARFRLDLRPRIPRAEAMTAATDRAASAQLCKRIVCKRIEGRESRRAAVSTRIRTTRLVYEGAHVPNRTV
jgi:hypothetical protein